MKKHELLLLLMIIIIGLGAGQASAQEKPQVAVSIAAQGFLVEQIAADLVDVEVLIKPGQEPHTFEVTPRQMMKLSKAKVMFLLGFPFEERLTVKLKDVNRKLEVINTAEGIKKRMMAEHSHDHGHHGHEHDHGENADPHTWLSPAGVEMHARNIFNGLVKLMPAKENLLKENLDKLITQNSKMAELIKKRLGKYQGRSFMVFHPSFGYFADYAGLKQVAIEAAGKKPSARQLQEIIKRAKKARVDVIFIQPQFDKSSAQVVARSIGARLEVVDPLGADVFSFFDDMSAKLAAAYKK